MHEGCTGQFMSGKQVADKVRMMGYDKIAVPVPLEIACANCNEAFTMATMVAACPACEMVYAVTPCHAHSAESVQPAGIGYLSPGERTGSNG